MTVIQEDIDFLAHYGVKGMKWGVRRTQKVQKRIDRLSRVSEGTASRDDKVKAAALQGVYTSKGAKRVLARGATVQNRAYKINPGDKKLVRGYKKTNEILAKAAGLRINDLNYYEQPKPFVKKKG